MTISYHANLRFDEDYLTTYGYLPAQPAGNLLFRDIDDLVERYHLQALVERAMQETNPDKEKLYYDAVIENDLGNSHGVRSAANAVL